MTHPEPRHKGFDDSYRNRKDDLDYKKHRYRYFVGQHPNKEIRYQGAVHRKFQIGCVHDRSKIKTTVVKDHYFMNHRELKVCFRIVNWHPAVLDHSN